ncbi:unnamed protein product [Schistocephalus solidus]|uniref:Reverse transcriptase domain-containing protein n=1 Tax=Schistocephalus solidus TaxID=70667 RepID=A0A183T3V8_SCHSO|nr:unnamed protein product [Schistocephalus solidus]
MAPRTHSSGIKDATIVHLYKKNEKRQLGNNHGEILLPTIVRKIFTRLLLTRLKEHLDHGHLPNSRHSFRRHRGTTDGIFAARQLQENCKEMRTGITGNGTISEALAGTNVAKLNSLFTSTLYSRMFSAMLINAYGDERPEIHIVYRTDGRRWQIPNAFIHDRCPRPVLRGRLCAQQRNRSGYAKEKGPFSAKGELIINTDKNW